MIPIFTEKEIFYSLLTEEPLFDKNQNVVGIVGIFSDVDLNTSRRTLYNIEGYDENDNCMLFDYVYDQSKFIVVKKIPGFLSFYRPKLTIEEILNMKFIYEEDLYVVERFFNSNNFSSSIFSLWHKSKINTNTSPFSGGAFVLCKGNFYG